MPDSSQPPTVRPTHDVTARDTAGEAAASEVTLIQPNPEPPPARHTFTAAPTDPRFGEYQLLGEIARGGMGVVYRAQQTALGRVVALKMILAGRLATTEDVHRFRAEAIAAARLQHPHIVNVYDVGEVNGQHFFTMEYIEGQSLDQLLARGPLPGRIAARYLRTLARAVDYAHRNGIIHRDLKPSNVLIGGDDEPHVTDFGLAKQLGAGDSGQTRTGTVLGTPSYMSPEQAQGRTAELGPATDVYSLGAILYECLTGRPPFRAETPFDTMAQVIDHSPVPPRLLNPNIDADLEAICLKCLEKDTKLRYADAVGLAEDLNSYLEGESIQAGSFNVLDRLRGVLERSVHAESFSAWSSMLLAMAVVVGVEHLIVFTLIETGQPLVFILAARTMQFLLLGGLFLYHRGGSRLMPASAAERQLWTIWLGYIVVYGVTILTVRLLLRRGLIVGGPDAPGYLTELLPYPFVALASGLALFSMGSSYWGRCYAFGTAFFVLAVLMPLRLSWAPLVFGLLWSITLASLGLHLRRLGRHPGAARQPTPTVPAATVAYQDRPPTK